VSVNSYKNNPLSWHPDKALLKSPIYKSLVDLLQEDILSNQLTQDTKLPSQRELADYLDINFTTVGQAYQYAIKKGLLYTNVGSGTYVSPNAYHSATISNHNVKQNIIDFGLVSSFEEYNSLVVPFIQSVASSPKLIQLLDYQHPMGTNFQIETASKWLETQGVLPYTNHVAIVSGVQNGLAIVLSALFAPGDRIAVDRYTYSNFIELAHLYHLEIVPIDFDENGMSPEALNNECLKKKIQGIFLMPSCNNPIGFQISEERRYELAKIIKKMNLIVIEDDIHSFMTTYFQDKVLPPFQQLLPKQTIYLAGMTKYISSGLRIAYLVYPQNFKSAIEKALFNINVKTSGLDAEIITQIIHSSTAKKILENKFEKLQEANQLFDTVFESIKPQRPSNNYPLYRILNLKNKLTQEKQDTIENHLLNQGVRVFHSDRFSTQTQPDPFIRVALSSNNMEKLEKGLKIIKKEGKKYNQ
jgi:DNA-binding transcriptional MocR family regulator